LRRRPDSTPEIDALLDAFPAPVTATVHELRVVVREAVPEAVERVRVGWRLIGYDLPVGRRSVYFAWIWPQIEHVHLGWEFGTLLRDPRRILGGAELKLKKVRYLTFEPGDPIDARDAVAFTRQAADIAGMAADEREALRRSRG